MDVRLMKYIVEIGESGTVAKASEKLYVSYSALSQQLSKLEKELGTPLFTRFNGRYIPTPAGQIYIDAVKRIILLVIIK